MGREVFADRTYQQDGQLTPRSQPGAVLHDAQGQAIGWQQGSVLGVYAHGLFEQATVLQALFGATVPTLDQALRMLKAGRTDYLIYEENPALAFAAKLGVTGLAAASTPVSNENLYLTLSHKSPCNNGELRGRIAKAMAKLGKEGGMRKLLDNALRDWRRQSQE